MGRLQPWAWYHLAHWVPLHCLCLASRTWALVLVLQASLVVSARQLLVLATEVRLPRLLGLQVSLVRV